MLCWKPPWSDQLGVTYSDALKDIAHHTEQQWVWQNKGKVSEKGAVCLFCNELKTGARTLWTWAWEFPCWRELHVALWTEPGWGHWGNKRQVLCSPQMKVCHIRWKYRILGTGHARRSMTYQLMLLCQGHGFSDSVRFFLPMRLFPMQAIAPCVHLIQSFLGWFKEIWYPVWISAMFHNRCFDLKETGKTSRWKTLIVCWSLYSSSDWPSSFYCMLLGCSCTLRLELIKQSLLQCPVR